MSCLVVVKKTENIGKREGSTNIVSPAILTLEEYDKLKSNIYPRDQYIVIDEQTNDIHSILNSDKEFSTKFYLYYRDMENDKIFENIVRQNNIADVHGNTIAHVVNNIRTHFFTLDELLLLGNPSNNVGITVAHRMALNGFNFSLEELMTLGNPSDNNNDTVAHNMVFKGHCFSNEELLKLGNPANNEGNTLAHGMIQNGFFPNSDTIIMLGNPSNSLGRSLTNLMERRGFMFSEKDKYKLMYFGVWK